MNTQVREHDGSLFATLKIKGLAETGTTAPKNNYRALDPILLHQQGRGGRSYLFVIVRKAELSELRPGIIREIEGMSRVRINGRRFFNGFEPRMANRRPDLLYQQFPEYRPYSQSVWARKGQEFDWRRELEI